MARKSSRINLDRAQKVFERFVFMYRRNMQKAANQHGAQFVRVMKERRFTGYEGRTPESGKLQNRTGTLRKSIDFTPLEPVIGGRIGVICYTSGVKYARMQEYGGEVTPRRAKNLTIPLEDNLTKAGVTRYGSARDLIDQHGMWKPSERRYGQMQFIKSPKSGLTFLVSRNKPGQGSQPTPRGKGSRKSRRKAKPPKLYFLFVLKKSVTLPSPGRFRFRATFESNGLQQDRLRRWRNAAKVSAKEAKS
jgi:hypothetical protein